MNELQTLEYIAYKINKARNSDEFDDIRTGFRYFDGRQDIAKHRRTIVDNCDETRTLTKLPNNHIVDNQYKKLVLQKNNYLLGKPITFRTENAKYSELLSGIMGANFQRVINAVGKDSLNGGVGWLLIDYDESGGLCFKRVKPCDLVPDWADAEKTQLRAAYILNDAHKYQNGTEIKLETVEVLTPEGAAYYLRSGGTLRQLTDVVPHIIAGAGGYNWGRVPVVQFKSNAEGKPLIKNVKSLQDALNKALSTFMNNMEEDAYSSILVLKDFASEDLEKLRSNLINQRAISLGPSGGVEVLNVEVNADNYKALIDTLKRAIIENGGGFDSKSDRLGASPNQMNIQSMYSDIDLAADEMEREFQTGFMELLDFVNLHLYNTGAGDFSGERVEVILNRDMLMNESDIISNIRNSVGILSEETLIAQYPWIDDPRAEMERIKQERRELDAERSQYGDAFA